MEIWGGSGASHDAVSAPGLDVWLFSRPYRGAARGGDIHYLSGCASGNIIRIVVADVAGHGETVAEVSRSLRKLMRRHINTPDQSKLARAVNRAFSAESSSGLFATAVLGTYWAPERTFLFVNAGHPRPLLSRGNGPWVALHPGSPEVRREGRLEGFIDLPLGVISETEYEQVAVRLEVGDRVLLYTDSAVETRDLEGTPMGEAGLIGLLDGYDGEDDGFVAAVAEGLGRHAGASELDDDLTLVMLRHNDSPRPSPGVGDRLRTLGRLIGVIPV